MRRPLLALTAALALLGSACDIATSPFAPGLNVDLPAMTRSASGLYTQDLVVGDGPTAAAGNRLFVRYSGWLPNGQRFDSNMSAGEPFSFVLGASQVIAGWDEGLVGMRVNGLRKLVIPPGLAYGPGGSGIVPANATLVFEVRLLGIE